MPKNSSFSCFMVIFMSYCPQFLGFSRICMSRKNPGMFERYDQKLAVLAFYGCFAHGFWVSAGFACLERTLTCLRDMTRNSPFSRFMVIFMSYCPQFLGFSRICMSRKNPNMFERYDQKLAVLAFYGHFHELCPQFLGFSRICMSRKNPNIFEKYDQNLAVLAFYVHFHDLCPQFLGFSRICMSRKNPNMFERYDQKLAVLAFYGRFHELLPTV